MFNTEIGGSINDLEDVYYDDFYDDFYDDGEDEDVDYDEPDSLEWPKRFDDYLD